MSIQNQGQPESYYAGADLSAKQWYAVKIDTDGDVVLAGAGDDAVVGFLQNAPADTKPASVIFDDGMQSKAIVVDASAAIGTALKVDANGKLTAAATTEEYCAINTQAVTAANDIVNVRIVKSQLA